MVTDRAAPDSSSPLIYLIVGESSGDNLGAGLMDEIRERCPGARFMGVGGPAMEERGLSSLFPMSDLSVMGIAEILPRLRLLLRRIRETVSNIQAQRPDVIVTIDSPDFSFRVARRLNGAGIPLVHYVAPTVWAWRVKRAAKVAKLYDHLLTLFPFEPPYFEREGLASTFVGHPVINTKPGNGEKFRKEHKITPETPVLCLLPGSRRSEISRLLPVFLQTLDLLKLDIPTIRCVLPTVPHLENEIRDFLVGHQGVSVVVGPEQKADAYAASNAALAASGTVALELAIARVPSVIAYILNTATAMVARRMIKIPYKSLVNILLEKEVMPELLQENCTPSALCAEILPLLLASDAHSRQLAAFDLVRQKLSPGKESPNSVAAGQVLRVTNGFTRPT